MFRDGTGAGATGSVIWIDQGSNLRRSHRDILPGPESESVPEPRYFLKTGARVGAAQFCRLWIAVIY